MQDYPEDGGEGMSQVFNGQKMLLDVPSPPAVRVDGTIYFTNELLQECSGDYFIPERFFLAPSSDSAGSDTAEHHNSVTKVLYALGRAVERTEVHDPDHTCASIDVLNPLGWFHYQRRKRNYPNIYVHAII